MTIAHLRRPPIEFVRVLTSYFDPGIRKKASQGAFDSDHEGFIFYLKGCVELVLSEEEDGFIATFLDDEGSDEQACHEDGPFENSQAGAAAFAESLAEEFDLPGNA